MLADSSIIDFLSQIFIVMILKLPTVFPTVCAADCVLQTAERITHPDQECYNIRQGFSVLQLSSMVILPILSLLRDFTYNGDLIKSGANQFKKAKFQKRRIDLRK